jgi:transglutaminase/protease-like cytokinesis protein 3
MAIYDREWYRKDKENNFNDGNKKISKEEADKLKILVEGTTNNNQTNEPPKANPKYSNEYIGKQKEEFDHIQWKVDELIKNIDKNNMNKSFYEIIYFLMDCVHNNITYDDNLKDLIDRKDSNNTLFKNFYDYKNSAEEVFKNKKATCVGFSNSLKKLCDISGINCKIFYYHNYKRNIHHQLNIAFDNNKKYYIDPTWGFIVEDMDTLKKIYRGELPNPRTNQYNKLEDYKVNYEIKESVSVRIINKLLQNGIKILYVFLILIILLIIYLIIFK